MKFNNIEIDIKVRYLNGDCSLDEEEKLNSRLEEDPDNTELKAGEKIDNKLTATFSDTQRIDDVLESISLVMDVMNIEKTDSASNRFTVLK